MGYSTSPFTLDRIAPEFALLIVARACVWKRPKDAKHDWASKLAYKLREGLYLAGVFEDRHPSLSAIADHVKVTTTRDMVVAVVMEHQAEIEFAPQAEPLNAPALAEPGDFKHLTYEAVWGLVQQRIKDGYAMKLHIPGHSLTAYEINALAANLLVKGWMLLADRSGALTMAPDDPDVPAEAKVRP